ncbi:CPBP family intramembrane glutamic endopeptidase [Streptococcus didelphis]
MISYRESGSVGEVPYGLTHFLQTPIYFLAYLLVNCISQPILEEILFRGCLLYSLKPLSAIVALVFAYVHGSDGFTIFHFLSGILYGYLFIKVKTIWPFVICYSIHNLIVLIIVIILS